MDRLTKRNENGVAVLNVKCPEGCEHSTCSIEEGYQCQHQCEGDIIERLAQYEELEEQGLLFKLPCPIGTEVWTIMCGMTGKHPTLFKQSFDYSMIEHFGKAVFLNKEEAQQRINKMSK